MNKRGLMIGAVVAVGVAAVVFTRRAQAGQVGALVAPAVHPSVDPPMQLDRVPSSVWDAFGGNPFGAFQKYIPL